MLGRRLRRLPSIGWTLFQCSPRGCRVRWAAGLYRTIVTRRPLHLLKRRVDSEPLKMTRGSGHGRVTGVRPVTCAWQRLPVPGHRVVTGLAGHTIWCNRPRQPASLYHLSGHQHPAVGGGCFEGLEPPPLVHSSTDRWIGPPDGGQSANSPFLSSYCRKQRYNCSRLFAAFSCFSPLINHPLAGLRPSLISIHIRAWIAPAIHAWMWMEIT